MKPKISILNISLTLLMFWKCLEICKGKPQVIYHLQGYPEQRYNPYETYVVGSPVDVPVQENHQAVSPYRTFLPFIPFVKTLTAKLTLVPGNNTNIQGSLYFYRVFYGVLIEGEISGLSPGHHGFHVHETGSIGNKCADAGPHFNPFATNHGSPKNPVRHVGDLGNIEVNYFGAARFKIFDSLISFDPSSEAYIGGRAVVVHAMRDDLGLGGNADSLKTGNAGAREGCGIIVVL